MATPGRGEASGQNPAKKKYEAVVVPNAEQIFQQEIMDSCILRFFMSGLAGGAMGAVMGLVFGSFSLEMTPGVCHRQSPLAEPGLPDMCVGAPWSSGPARQVWLASFQMDDRTMRVVDRMRVQTRNPCRWK